MKTYSELYFKGTAQQLSEFVQEIGNYAAGDWKFEKQSERWKDYLFFDYMGDAVNKVLSDRLLSGQTANCFRTDL